MLPQLFVTLEQLPDHVDAFDQPLGKLLIVATSLAAFPLKAGTGDVALFRVLGAQLLGVLGCILGVSNDMAGSATARTGVQVSDEVYMVVGLAQFLIEVLYLLF